MVSARAGSLGALGAVLVVVLGLGLARRPVEPLPAEAGAEVFSEARALPLVEELAGRLGPRPLGSPEASRAAGLLAERLRAIPGVEVERQEVSGTETDEGALVVYRVVNVLARLPGERPEAVLLSAHYDSPAESPGAADDGLGVAAAVEVMRALAAGPRPRHTVVLNLNGGEERGRLGAAGFLRHPWARDVRAFVNLEASGSGGRAILFRVGPAEAGLLEAYAASVPYPSGSVFGQDLVGSGAVPLFTDFEAYAGGGLRGLDMATIEDGYAYHTELDRPGRLEPGMLQHLGDNTLALVRHLAAHPLEPGSGEPAGAFFDVLGRVMIVYSRRTAGVLAVLAVLLAAGAWVAAVRRGGVTVRGLVRGGAWTGLGGLLGLLVPLAGALGVGLVLGRPHGWFQRPWLGGVTYGALALGGVFAAEALWARRAAHQGVMAPVRALERWGGALFWGCAFLLLGTWTGLGASYIPLLWVLGGAGGLLLAVLAPQWRGLGLVLAFLPGAVVTGQLALLVLSLAVPLTGHLMVPFPLDGAIALLVAIPLCFAGWLAPVLWPWEAGGRRALGAVSLCAVVGWGALALVPAYSAERPRRLRAVERATPEGSSLVLQSLDGLPLGTLVPGLSGADGAGWQASRPVEGHGLPPPRWAVVREERHGAEREVTVRFHAPPRAELKLEVPGGALAAWSLGSEPPVLPEGATAHSVQVVTPPEEGWELTLRLRGSEPVRLRVVARREGAVTPTLQALRGALAPEATGSFAASHQLEVEL